MLTKTTKVDWNDADLTDEILRLDGAILAFVLGLMTGLLVFVATNWLVIKGGPNVGQHLRLLRQFLPGYSVSFLGSLIGLTYGVVLGGVTGWSLAWVYNWVAFRRR